MYMLFSKSLQGSKYAITKRPVSIELTLLLFNRDLNRGCLVYMCFFFVFQEVNF